MLVGVDQRGREVTNLTDTMMVASLDPVGKTVSLVSIPRDLIDTPLGNFRQTLRTIWLSDPDGVTNYFAQIMRRAAPDSRRWPATGMPMSRVAAVSRSI